MRIVAFQLKVLGRIMRNVSFRFALGIASRVDRIHSQMSLRTNTTADDDNEIRWLDTDLYKVQHLLSNNMVIMP